MDGIHIFEVSDGGLHVIKDNTTSYEVHLDRITRDWCIISNDDDTIQQVWVQSRDGALNYLLEHTGMVEDGKYERAPDRC